LSSLPAPVWVARAVLLLLLSLLLLLLSLLLLPAPV
jgi:hypothetical protein